MDGQPQHPPLSNARLAPVVAWTLLDGVIAAALALGAVVALTAVLFGLRAVGVTLGEPVAALRGLPALFVPLSLLGTTLAGVVLWALHRRRLPVAPSPWSTRRLGQVVLAVIAMQGIVMGFLALTRAVGLEVEGRNLALLEQAFAGAPGLTVLAVVVFVPLGEELIFRRVLLQRFMHAGRPGLGLLLTSLLFAWVHEPLPGQREVASWLLTLLTYLTLGLGFGWVYMRSGRLDAALLCHGLLNAVGVAMLIAR
jgi:membrane protease YdiL (CAAX protease family)